VVKDFHFKNLLEEISPAVLFLETNYLNYLYIKLSDAPVARVLNFVENRWHIFSPDMPFEYSMLRDRYGKDLLLGIKKWSGLAGLISFFILFFSCLGLFGLASYSTQKRTKEIGIRKALGASVGSITFLLSKEFVKWVLLANIVAWPLAIYVMNKWLQNFAYKASIGWFVLVFAALTTLLIATFSFIFQAVKAAYANPVDSLRYE